MIKSSIIIRAYNAENTIERAVLSALGQNFSRDEFEVIIVNDGSSDKTKEILHKFEEKKNFFIIDQKNQGGILAANHGLEASKGEYVTLLDGDDAFEPGLLRELSSVLDEDKSATFAYSDYYEDKDGIRCLVSPKNIFETLMGGVLFHRRNFAEQNWYREGIFFTEYDLLLRTLSVWKNCYVPKPLFTYFRRSDSATAAPETVRRGLDELRRIHPDKLDLISKIRDY